MGEALAMSDEVAVAAASDAAASDAVVAAVSDAVVAAVSGEVFDVVCDWMAVVEMEECLVHDHPPAVCYCPGSAASRRRRKGGIRRGGHCQT